MTCVYEDVDTGCCKRHRTTCTGKFCVLKWLINTSVILDTEQPLLISKCSVPKCLSTASAMTKVTTTSASIVKATSQWQDLSQGIDGPPAIPAQEQGRLPFVLVTYFMYVSICRNCSNGASGWLYINNICRLFCGLWQCSLSFLTI